MASFGAINCSWTGGYFQHDMITCRDLDSGAQLLKSSFSNEENGSVLLPEAIRAQTWIKRRRSTCVYHKLKGHSWSKGSCSDTKKVKIMIKYMYVSFECFRAESMKPKKFSLNVSLSIAFRSTRPYFSLLFIVFGSSIECDSNCIWMLSNPMFKYTCERHKIIRIALFVACKCTSKYWVLCLLFENLIRETDTFNRQNFLE